MISLFNMNTIGWHLYGDATFTSRTYIWDFALNEIGRKPYFGWGYQSFWLVGPDAPSVVEAPGFLKDMPHAHNGYYDTMLEMGKVGLWLLIIFIIATLLAIGRQTDRSPGRAWLLFSLAVLVILTNFLETSWMRGFSIMWVMFLVVAAESGRYQYARPLHIDDRVNRMRRFEQSRSSAAALEPGVSRPLKSS
jgi:O-antigen ligase